MFMGGADVIWSAREAAMNEELARLRLERKEAHDVLTRLGGGTYSAFLDMERAA